MKLLGHYVDPHDEGSFDTQVSVTPQGTEAWGQICFIALPKLKKGDLLYVIGRSETRNDTEGPVEFVHQLVIDDCWTPDGVDRTATGEYLLPLGGTDVTREMHYALGNLVASWQALRDYPKGAQLQYRVRAHADNVLPGTCTIMDPRYYSSLTCDLWRDA